MNASLRKGGIAIPIVSGNGLVETQFNTEEDRGGVSNQPPSLVLLTSRSPSTTRSKWHGQDHLPSTISKACTTFKQQNFTTSTAFANTLQEIGYTTQVETHSPASTIVCEDNVVTSSDSTLNHLQQSIGKSLLSLLPHLDKMIFKKVQHNQPGHLPIRLCFGTLKASAQPHLRGHKVWAIYKSHEKLSQMAPRLCLQAFCTDNDQLIEENLNFYNVLPKITLLSPFNGIRGSPRKQELQLKAIIKYYFILAANAKLYGFGQHCMPANATFVENLRALCIQMQDGDGDMMRVDPEPQLHSRRDEVTPKYGEKTSSISDADNEGVTTRRKGAMQSSQRLTMQPSIGGSMVRSAATTNRTRRGSKLASRQLALGSSGSPGCPPVNEFLDPNAEVLSSDGESGDEIPASIPGPIASLLRRRLDTTNALEHNRRVLEEARDGERDASRQANQVKKKMRGGRNLTELNSQLGILRQQVRGHQIQIEVRKEAVQRLAATEKRLSKEIGLVDKGLVTLWEQMPRSDSESSDDSSMEVRF